LSKSVGRFLDSKLWTGEIKSNTIEMCFTDEKARNSVSDFDCAYADVID